MKAASFFLAIILLCAGCAAKKEAGNVSFEWFNLSTNQIWVTDLVGLPGEASAGRMLPDKAEDQLESKGSTFMETVQFGERIKISWKENDPTGWPGGLKTGERVPPGETHSAEYSRDELGIPPKLNIGKVRFTYLGGDKWRVKLFASPE